MGCRYSSSSPDAQVFTNYKYTARYSLYTLLHPHPKICFYLLYSNFLFLQIQSDNSPVDDGIYWSVNFTRFEQFFRDQAIVLAMRKKHGIECGEITRAMLRISEVTTSADATKTQAISAAEISRAIAAGYSISAEVGSCYW